jgi:hypothetical protein
MRTGTKVVDDYEIDLSKREKDLYVSQDVEEPPPDPEVPLPDESSHSSEKEVIDLEKEIEIGLRFREGEVDIESRRVDVVLRHFIGYTLQASCVITTLASLSVIFFVGFGLMDLSEKLVMAMLGVTVVHDTTMVYLVRYLFRF